MKMNDRQQLNRAKIEEAFRAMGQYLLDRKALGEIVIYGGSAILLQFDWRKTSLDVDAKVISETRHELTKSPSTPRQPWSISGIIVDTANVTRLTLSDIARVLRLFGVANLFLQ